MILNVETDSTNANQALQSRKISAHDTIGRTVKVNIRVERTNTPLPRTVSPKIMRNYLKHTLAAF